MSGKTGKPPVSNLERTVLSDDWAVLSKYAFDYQRRDGNRERQDREVYHRGDSVAVLPHDAARGTVLLLRQFRLPAYLTDGDGFLIEACAGAMEDERAEACARREALEELGCRLDTLEPVALAYSSPGSLTERVFCFTAPYSPRDRISDGGGRSDEGEDIEVIEIALDDALAMIASGGIIDMKTILLLQQLNLSRPERA